MVGFWTKRNRESTDEWGNRDRGLEGGGREPSRRKRKSNLSLRKNSGGGISTKPNKTPKRYVGETTLSPGNQGLKKVVNIAYMAGFNVGISGQKKVRIWVCQDPILEKKKLKKKKNTDYQRDQVLIFRTHVGEESLNWP